MLVWITLTWRFMFKWHMWNTYGTLWSLEMTSVNESLYTVVYWQPLQFTWPCTIAGWRPAFYRQLQTAGFTPNTNRERLSVLNYQQSQLSVGCLEYIQCSNSVFEYLYLNGVYLVLSIVVAVINQKDLDQTVFTVARQWHINHDSLDLGIGVTLLTNMFHFLSCVFWTTSQRTVLKSHPHTHCL